MADESALAHKKRKALDQYGNGYIEDAGFYVPESKIRMMLDPLSREAVVELLCRICSRDYNSYMIIRDKAGTDPAFRKLFVRGLPYTATDADLANIFAQYGEIEEATVVYDKLKNQCKGYGFLTFKDLDSAHAALEEPTKFYDGREIHCNLAAVGAHTFTSTSGAFDTPSAEGQVKDMDSDLALRKIFVRGLNYETTNQSFIALFSQYGEVEEGSIALDRNTGKSRGYGFITYRSKVDAMRCLEQPEKQLDGRTIHVNLASHDPKQGGSPDNIALRKVFVRGLNYDTSNDEFLQLFSEYGEIEEGNIALDKATGKSKGYGFVTYKSPISAMKCLEIPQKQLDGRTVHCNLAEKGKKAKTVTPLDPVAAYYSAQTAAWSAGAPYAAYAQQPMQAAAYGAYPQQQQQTRWPAQQGWSQQANSAYSHQGYMR